MLNVSESLGNKWYRTTKTRAEKSIEKVVKEREKHMKNEDDKDKLVRQIDDQFRINESKSKLETELKSNQPNRSRSLIEETEKELNRRFEAMKIELEQESLKAIESAQLRKEVFLMEKNLVMFDQIDQYTDATFHL